MNQVFEESKTRLSPHSNCFILFWLRTRPCRITKSKAGHLGCTPEGVAQHERVALRARPRYSNRVGFRIILENTGVKWDQRCHEATSFGSCANSSEALAGRRPAVAQRVLAPSLGSPKANQRATKSPLGCYATKLVGPYGAPLLSRRHDNFSSAKSKPVLGPFGAQQELRSATSPFGAIGCYAPPRPTVGHRQRSCLWPPKNVLSVQSKPPSLRSSYGNNIGRRRGDCSARLRSSKQSKQQSLVFGQLLAFGQQERSSSSRTSRKLLLRDTFKTKSGLNKTRINRRLKHPFTVWGFVMDTKCCRMEILGCRTPSGARLAPKGVQPTRTLLAQPKGEHGQSEHSSGLQAEGLCNIVTKTRYKTIRPLLNLSRENLTTLCKDLRLPVYPDKSNKAVQYSRNRLREQILPAVKLFLNPKIDDALFKLAELLTQDFSVVSHLVNTGRRLK